MDIQYKPLSTILVLIFLIPTFGYAQSTMQSTIGGNSLEFCWDMIGTLDNNHIIVGSTNSYGPLNGNAYVMKINSMGDTIWTKSFGGSLSDAAYSVQQTKDLGFIVAGSTRSFGVDVSDAYLVKLNNSGNIEWSRTYGGIYSDNICSVIPIIDTGYMLLGSTSSFGLDSDIYLIKTDLIGDTLWTKTIGGTSEDYGLDMIRTLDGNYVITGYTESFGAGQTDAFLLKVDNDGNILWVKSYGGLDGESINTVLQSSDEGYLISGKTHSFGSIDGDIYLVKTDGLGDTLWTKKYGGLGTDHAKSIIQTTNSGYLIIGETLSHGAGATDVFLLAIDSIGNILWSKAYGGSWHDRGQAINKIDNGYMLAGYTSSFGAGSGDFYILKIDSLGTTGCNEIDVITNVSSTPTVVTSQTFYSSNTTTVISSPLTLIGNGGISNPLCNNVGHDELNFNQQISIFPNPSTDQVTIQLNNLSLKDHSLKLYTIQGQEVPILNSISLDKITVDVRLLSPGLYYFQLYNENKSYFSEKFVVN
ncbi:MAG: T9SS type A sorting domain-containing protein [Crocinitomicaceae bacterium]|nr:T9SS type A sorting domain-containing protein [Flavobacteriales bacterium]NQZ34355.1 T9SS type A sorting domain-containing protein [Crocinitomicaceae bacterium]